MADTPTLQADQIADALITAPGIFIQALTYVPGGNRDLTSADSAFETIGSDEADPATGTFAVPVTGTYRVTLRGAHYAFNSALAEYRVTFDKGGYGGFTEQNVGTLWRDYRDDSSHAVISFSNVTVELERGIHQVDIEGKWVSGDTWRINVNDEWSVSLELVTGSGAGGVLVSSAVLAANYTVPASWADVDNGGGDALTVDIDAVQNEWVQVTLFGWAQHVSLGTCFVRLDANGATSEEIVFSNSTAFGTNASATWYFQLNAGANTIKVQAKQDNTVSIWAGTTLFVQQYRGGLVPVQQVGTSIVDTPRAFNFLGALIENTLGVADIHMGSTAPGVRVEVFRSSASTDVSSSSTSFVAVDGNFTVANVAVPVTGKYRVTLLGQTAGQAFTTFMYTRFRVNIDSGAQYVGGDETPSNYGWDVPHRVLDHWDTIALEDEVELTAGTHSFSLEWMRSSTGGGGNMYTNSTVAWTLILESITGSGAGGLITQTSTLSAEFSEAVVANVFEDIPNLDPISIITHEGEYILASFSGTINNPTNADVSVCIVVDSTPSPSVYHSLTHNRNLSHTRIIGPLSAGPHTVKAQMASSGNHTLTGRVIYPATSNDVALTLDVIQYRGGQVPIQKNGTVITSAPFAFNFVGDNVNVTNVGGKAQIDFNGVADGIEGSSPVVLAADFSNSSSSSWQDVDNGGGDALTMVVEGAIGETVLLECRGYVSRGTGTEAYIRFVVDGTEIYSFLGDIAPGETANAAWAFRAREFLTLTAESQTVKLQMYTAANTNTVLNLGAHIKYYRWLGGYVKPENTPILEYSSASVVNVAASPGASSTLRMILSDGVRYTATSPLSVDLTASGLGGLDTGSEASSTWYYVYAVPSATAGVFDVVASVTDPDAGGPTGYDVWRYLGSIVNDSSSNIREFIQCGNRIWCQGPTEISNTTNDADYVAWDTTEAPITASAYFVWYRLQLNVSGDWELRLRPDGFTANDSVDHLVGSNWDGVTGEVYLPRGNTARRIYYRKIAYSGILNQGRLRIVGWIDGHLSGNAEARAQAAPTAQNLWRYFTATDLPTGAAAPEAVWAFDGSGTELNDLTANAHNLTVEGGSVIHAAAEGLLGLSSKDDFRLSIASPAGLRTTGAVTAVFLVSVDPFDTNTSNFIWGSVVNSAAEADNTNYLFYTSTDHIFRAFHEYGSGSSEAIIFAARQLTGAVQDVVFTRSSDGLTHKVYVDGQLVDTQTASNAPTGGGNAVFYLMGGEGGGVAANRFTGTMLCGMVTKEEWSAAQVLEHYQWARRLTL